MELTLQHLRLLREVARQSTITAAADTLGYTRSAVSQQLMGLERATGVQVLERVGRNVRLTDAGRVLVDNAEEILSKVESAQAALEAAAGGVQGVLEIGIYESIAVPLLAPLVETMRSMYPGLRIRSREVEPDSALEALVVGDLDLAFTLTYPHDRAQQLPAIVRTPIVDERFVAVFPAGSARSAPIDLRDLGEREFISPPPTSGCGRAIVAACREAGFEPDIVHQIDNYPTTLNLVAAGCGVALIPEFSVPHRSDLEVCDLLVPVSRTIDISHRRSSAERPAIQATLAALKEIQCGEARLAV